MPTRVNTSRRFRRHEPRPAAGHRSTDARAAIAEHLADAPETISGRRAQQLAHHLERTATRLAAHANLEHAAAYDAAAHRWGPRYDQALDRVTVYDDRAAACTALALRVWLTV